MEKGFGYSRREDDYNRLKKVFGIALRAAEEAKKNGGLIDPKYRIEAFMTIVGPIEISMESETDTIDDTVQ